MINRNIQLKILKRSQPEWALIIVLLMPIFSGALIDILHFPSGVKYFIDISLILLIVLSIINLVKKKVVLIKEVRFITVWILLFLVLTLIVYMARYQSLLYYIWGVRNNFRYYMAFLACILFFEKADIDKFLKFFDVFFWCNSAFCLIQFLFFDIRGDYLGGFFGLEKGCNAYLNIFMIIITTKAIVFCLNKKEGVWLCISKCSVGLLVAALAEIKFFFVEFLVILVIASVITQISLRKIIILVVGLLAIMVAASILITLFPHFANFLSIDFIIDSTSTGGYSAAGQLNRLTTIPTISKKILTTPSLKWFGLGLGNCDTSNFEFLKTPFYYNYIHLRYNWFSSSFIYLETGFIGLILFFGFFLILGVKSFIMSKKDNAVKEYGQIALIAAVLCIMLGIYDSSLRTEAGYMMYFVLSFPFIAKKAVISDGQ